MELDLRSFAVEALDRQLVVDHGNDDAAMLRFQRFIDNQHVIGEAAGPGHALPGYLHIAGILALGDGSLIIS